MTMRVAEVAIPLPLPRTFHYLAPENLSETLVAGVRVRVPFGPRKQIGFFMGFVEEPRVEGLREIESCVDDVPLLDAERLDLGRAIAARWFCGPGEALQAMIPAGVKKGARGRLTAIVRPLQDAAKEALSDWPKRGSVKQRDLLKHILEHPDGIPRQELEREHQVSASPLQTLAKKGLIEIRRERLERDVFENLSIVANEAPPFTKEQARAAASITQAIDSDRYRGLLIFGVTGSGKTEVYLDAIHQTLAKKRSAIVLVPEISLTPQTVERFESRFPGRVAVLHSHLTDAERADQWRALDSGKKVIAIGPRSAIFAPVHNLGLIVLDEEHETTFKQQNVPRYHARDVAIMRGERAQAVVLFGSATPSLESFAASRRGELELITMTERVGSKTLPKVTRVDLRAHPPSGPGGVLSPLLINMLRRALDEGEQSLLFLNRRGFRTTIKCKRCGLQETCRDCDVGMTWYRERDLILCHQCGRQERTPQRCRDCGSSEIKFAGFGTELVEHAAQRLFPKARVARVDSVTMRDRGAHERLFAQIRRREIDIIVGTQMIAKGLDFPDITTIGVVAADGSLALPDFRSAERTFQLVTQVAGRAGRGEKAGRVFVQSWSPEHYALEAASQHDYLAFVEEELAHRRAAGYPPFGFLARVVLQGLEEKKVISESARLRTALEPLAAEHGTAILGPAAAPISIIKKLHRHHLVLRSTKKGDIEAIMKKGAEHMRSRRGVQLLVDVDPVSMM